MWFTKAAGGNDSPDSVSQFALEIPHSRAALDLFPGEHQKIATFVFAETKHSLFFCPSEEEKSEGRPSHSRTTWKEAVMKCGVSLCSQAAREEVATVL